MVGYWDQKLRCRFANRTFSDWFGRSTAEMAAMTMPEIFGEELFQSSTAAIAAVLRGEPQQYERELRTPSGEWGCVAADLIPDRADGGVAGFFVMVTDVTKLKRTEAELRRSNEKLAEALAEAEGASVAKSRFLANMSHEIRTPMNGVTGMLEILGQTELDQDQLRIVGTISGSAHSLLQVIDDILDFSKIEAGQLKIANSAVDPAEIVESITRLFQNAALAKGLTLRCFVAPSVRGQYLADRGRLRQILSNLISNAIKFTPCGGVTVTAEATPAEDGAAHLRLAVADTGIGIMPEAQARLFQPFTQADDSTARKFGGSGLGLSICRRLADLMGGKIELHSVYDVGTEVTLSLPARLVASGAGDAVLDLGGVGVALITPDQDEQRYFSAYLTHWGAEVTVIAPRSQPILPPGARFSLVLAPLAAMAETRAAAGPARRFVFYSYSDEPVDRNLGDGVIVTTALSRARIITAIAAAAGRQSPEVENIRPPPRLALGRAAPSRDQALREGRLILMAEDHPVNREVIQRQLHLLGYAADVVEDGEAALAALRRTGYALLLTDCGMPGMDGYELAGRIRRAEDGGRRLPIIALTASALAGEEQRCLAAGMDDYLAKPAGMAELRACLERWLPSAGLPVGGIVPAPSLPRSGGTPAFDLAVLAESCGDDPAAIQRSLRLFSDTLRSDLARLSAAVAAADAGEAQLFAHRLKGAAGIVGGDRLAVHCGAVERAAVACDWVAVAQEMPALLAVAAEADRACVDHLSA